MLFFPAAEVNGASAHERQKGNRKGTGGADRAEICVEAGSFGGRVEPVRKVNRRVNPWGWARGSAPARIRIAPGVGYRGTIVDAARRGIHLPAGSGWGYG